jgi:putative ABC transport system permease protein
VAAFLAQGLSLATGSALQRQVTAEYVISPQRDVLPPEVQRTLTAAGIASTGIRTGTVHAFGSNEAITAVDPATIGRFYHFQWADGSSGTLLKSLNGAGVLVASDYAAAHRLYPGMTLTAETTAGATLRMVIRGVYTSPTISPLLGSMTIGTRLFDRSFTSPGDREVYVDVPGGPSAAGRNAIKAALASFPTARIQSFDQFAAASEATIGQVLNLFYVLLALSIVISLFGIVNTLALSVAERTREIGVLRAIGMTRRQIARMICTEGVIIALIGTLTGITSGLVLAVAATQILSTAGVVFSVPWVTIAVLIGVTVLSGAVASVFPARRAARLDPITALSYE